MRAPCCVHARVVISDFSLFTFCPQTWYTDTRYNKITALIWPVKMIIYPFCIWNFIIIIEVVQKLFHSAFSRKIEHDWFWFYQWFTGRLSTSVKIPSSFQNKCLCSISENRNGGCKTVSIVLSNLDCNEMQRSRICEQGRTCIHCIFSCNLTWKESRSI